MILTLHHGCHLKPGRTLLGRLGNTMPNTEVDGAFYLTDNHDYALYFARGSGSISTYRVNVNQVLDLTDRDICDEMQAKHDDLMIQAGLKPWDEMNGDAYESAYMLLESAVFVRWLKGQGFDGVFIPEDIELGVRSYAVFSTDVLTWENTTILHEMYPENDSPEP